MPEYSTPVSAGTENDGADAPGWEGAMAKIDAEIDELRDLLARHRAADEVSPGDGPDDPDA